MCGIEGTKQSNRAKPFSKRRDSKHGPTRLSNYCHILMFLLFLSNFGTSIYSLNTIQIKQYQPYAGYVYFLVTLINI